jgi:hypothetical protein
MPMEKDLPTKFTANLNWLSYDKIKELLAGDSKTVLEKLNNDKGFQLVKAMADKFKKVAPKYDEINLKNTALQRTYMKAHFGIESKKQNFSRCQ